MKYLLVKSTHAYVENLENADKEKQKFIQVPALQNNVANLLVFTF